MYKSGIGYQGADYTKTDKSSPGIVHQGADYTKTDQVFPWHLSRSYQETDYMSEYVCACVCVYD